MKRTRTTLDRKLGIAGFEAVDIAIPIETFIDGKRRTDPKKDYCSRDRSRPCSRSCPGAWSSSSSGH
ncbi:MAG TPA: hypothetical protein VMV90_02340 [Rectinemataceae bacterium]|nr:hypothetical protein [Rectinemataceae bacterium]